MIFTAEQLTALGVPAELHQAIIDASEAAHKAAIDKSYIPRARFDAEVDKLKTTQGQVEELNKQLASLATSKGDADALKAQIADLQTKNAETQSQVAKANADADKRVAIASQLMLDGCVDPGEVASKFNLESVTLDSAGAPAGDYAAQRDAIKTAKAYYFSAQPQAAAAPAAGAQGQPAAAGQAPAGQAPAGQAPAGQFPSGWIPAGVTPQEGADGFGAMTPEAKGTKLVEGFIARQKETDASAAAAQNYYFGNGTAQPAAPAAAPGASGTTK